MTVILNGKKIKSEVSHSGKYARFAKSKALEKMKDRMPNGEKRHNLDLSKIKKGTKFGFGTFHI